MVLQEQTANMQNYDVLSGEIRLFSCAVRKVFGENVIIVHIVKIKKPKLLWAEIMKSSILWAYYTQLKSVDYKPLGTISTLVVNIITFRRKQMRFKINNRRK